MWTEKISNTITTVGNELGNQKIENKTQLKQVDNEKVQQEATPEDYKKEFLKELEKALLTVDPLVLVGLFQSQVRQLINLSFGNEKGIKNVGTLYSIARKRKPAWFLNLLKTLHEIEFEIKSGEGSKDALKKLIYLA